MKHFAATTPIAAACLCLLQAASVQAGPVTSDAQGLTVGAPENVTKRALDIRSRRFVDANADSTSAATVTAPAAPAAAVPAAPTVTLATPALQPAPAAAAATTPAATPALAVAAPVAPPAAAEPAPPIAVAEIVAAIIAAESGVAALTPAPTAAETVGGIEALAPTGAGPLPAGLLNPSAPGPDLANGELPEPQSALLVGAALAALAVASRRRKG